MTLAAAALSGLLFGLGLVVSGMVDPARVIGFLDITGEWDPSLAFVMGSALLPSSLAYAWRRGRERPLGADAFHVPDNRLVDAPLLAGAALFGVGWGLVGFCPGPALAALITLQGPVVLFVVAMLAGMVLHRLFPARIG